MSKRQEVVNAREIEQQHKNERERTENYILERQTKNTFLSTVFIKPYSSAESEFLSPRNY
jgi:hypothetical protein